MYLHYGNILVKILLRAINLPDKYKHFQDKCLLLYGCEFGFQGFGCGWKLSMLSLLPFGIKTTLTESN